MLDTWKRSEFLSYKDAHGDNPIDVKDFLNYVRHDNKHCNVSFFSNHMVDWCLDLLRERPKIKASSKIAIISTHLARRLYRMGVGLDADGEFVGLEGDPGYPFYEGHKELPVYSFREREVTMRDFQTLQEFYPTEFAALTGKRYVLIPVNNGYTSIATMGSAGTHWSFIVVDTFTRVASYIDSLAIPQTSQGNKYKITNIEMNGPVAGKVLCGFAKFMKYPKGCFKTSTIKWLPNQDTEGENFGRPDDGACGPYVYALMKYIVTNPELLVKGLRESFTKTKKQEYCEEIHFNSRISRNEIQAQLWDLRTAKEARNPTLHPMNLDPGSPTRVGNLLHVLSADILGIILAPGFLWSVYCASTATQKIAMLNPGVLRATLTREFLVSILIAHEGAQDNYRNEINSYKKDLGDDEDDEDGDDDDDDDDQILIYQTRTSASLQKDIENLRRMDEMTSSKLSDPASAAGALGLLSDCMSKKPLVNSTKARVIELERVLASRVASLAEYRKEDGQQLRAQARYFRDTEAYTPRQRLRELRNRQTRGQHVGKTRKQFYRWVARRRSELEEVLKAHEDDDGTLSNESLKNRITSFSTIIYTPPEHRPEALRSYRNMDWRVPSWVSDENFLQWVMDTRANYEKWLVDRVAEAARQ